MRERIGVDSIVVVERVEEVDHAIHDFFQVFFKLDSTVASFLLQLSDCFRRACDFLTAYLEHPRTALLEEWRVWADEAAMDLPLLALALNREVGERVIVDIALRGYSKLFN